MCDMAISGDKVITDKENKMIEKYSNLKKKRLKDFGTIRELT